MKEKIKKFAAEHRAAIGLGIYITAQIILIGAACLITKDLTTYQVLNNLNIKDVVRPDGRMAIVINGILYTHN